MSLRDRQPGGAWRATGDVPADLGRSVVVIGNFDGVHLGHRRVIARAREIADERGLQVVAVTFDPHPMAVLRPDHAPITLTSIGERAALLQDAGADAVLALPFTTEVAGWSPEEFVDRILVDLLHAAAVVVGANFRFGHRAAGDVALLTAAGAAQTEGHDFTTEGIPLDGGPMVWSSTYVRTCLAAGDVAGAAEALGRPVTVRGVVVRGDQRGRELGFPTANVPTAEATATPADGVYAGWLRRLDTARAPPRGDQRRHQPDVRRAPRASRREATCSTATTSSCTRSRSRSSSSSGCAAWSASTRSRSSSPR